MWWEKYLGRGFVPRRHECTHFVAQVMAEEFGLNLPHWSPPASHRACDAAAPELATRVLGAQTQRPVAGDCVLMTSAHGRRLQGYHVGVYVAAHVPCVLHCAPACGSVLTPMHQLSRVQLKLEGIYRWQTADAQI